LSQNVLAVIPARGGSKSIPGKNIISIHGKPLIAHTIAQALGSTQINRVLVSTDDSEIARVSCEYGAEVPFTRPADLAGDLSPDIDTFVHALEWLDQNEDYRPDLIVHLRATGPVRRIELIDRAELQRCRGLRNRGANRAKHCRLSIGRMDISISSARV